MEVTRQYVILKEKYRNVDEDALRNDPEFQRYLKIKEDFKAEYDQAKENLKFYNDVLEGLAKMQRKYGDDVDLLELNEFQPKNEEQFYAKLFVYIEIVTTGECDIVALISETEETRDYFKNQIDYGYNTRFDPRGDLVGDNYDDPYEKGYWKQSILHKQGVQQPRNTCGGESLLRSGR